MLIRDSEEIIENFQHIEAVFRIARKELLQSEIPLCVALDFNLHATKDELHPHYQRICFMGS